MQLESLYITSLTFNSEYKTNIFKLYGQNFFKKIEKC